MKKSPTNCPLLPAAARPTGVRFRRSRLVLFIYGVSIILPAAVKTAEAAFTVSLFLPSPAVVRHNNGAPFPPCSAHQHYTDKKWSSAAHYPGHQHTQRRQEQQRTIRLFAEKEQQRTTTSTKEDKPGSTQQTLLGKKQGVYSRPSAAIERGSGFYVPGLEGPKVRLVSGILCLGLLAINHVLSAVDTTSGSGDASSSAGNTFSEGLTLVYALLVLLQGAVQLRKESLSLVQEGQGPTTTTGGTAPPARPGVTYVKQWSIPIDNENWKSRVEWAAATVTSLTPATRMLLAGPGKVLFAWERTNNDDEDNSSDNKDRKYGEDEAYCQAALDTLAQSRSGRVALPPSHPVMQAIGDRCVVLQRIDDNLCWIMGSSDQLLAVFTPQDLKWLGQLARYVDPVEAI